MFFLQELPDDLIFLHDLSKFSCKRLMFDHIIYAPVDQLEIGKTVFDLSASGSPLEIGRVHAKGLIAVSRTFQ
jgi:hypothetical protein